MTRDEFRAARKTLGLSAQKMAYALGYADGRSIRRYEAGENKVPGAVAKLIAVMLAERVKPISRP